MFILGMKYLIYNIFMSQSFATAGIGCGDAHLHTPPPHPPPPPSSWRVESFYNVEEAIDDVSTKFLKI